MNSSPNADAKPLENRFVLDASALLASILKEPGSDAVDAAMRVGACASTVNEAEVISRLVDSGMAAPDAEMALQALEYAAIEFGSGQAFTAGRLRSATSHLGLGLGDRACLALAAMMELPVMTADRIWAQLDIDVKVVLCR